MNTVTLKRGRGTMKLEKSPDLIAIRPSPQANVNEVLANSPAEAAASGTTLDQFQIVKVNSSREGTDQALNELRRHHLVDAGSHVYFAPNSTAPIVPTGKITLRFTPTATEEQQNKVLADHHLEIVDASIDETEDGSQIDTFTVRTTPESLNPLKVAYELQTQSQDVVSLAEPDLATPGSLLQFQLPIDELLKDQWHLQNTGTQFGTTLGLKRGADARVVASWQRGQSLGSPACVVAVIDDGFDLTHPDLSGSNKIVAPWDFTTNTNNPAPQNFHPDPQRADYHGTACAGVAIGNANGTGIIGAAPNCRFMPVRWTSTISDETIKRQFAYVTAQGAWVVSCSWGAAPKNFELSTIMNEAIAKCARRGRNGLGCVIVFAAGNDNHDINDPAGGTLDGFAVHPDVIAVAACNSRDEKSNYSNFGREISVCAPSNGAGGRGILTSDVRGTFQFRGVNYDSGYEAGDYTRTFGGTSSATPLVAGICALILSANPSLSASQVRKILESTTRKIGPASAYVNRHSVFFGHGCVNAEAAVQKALALLTPTGNDRVPPRAGRDTEAPTDGKTTLFSSEFWGISRHELIAGVAAQLLTSRATAGVARLLEPLGQSLRQVAGWADQIKGRTPSPGLDFETNDFLSKFPDAQSRTWHYVDLPLGVDGYQHGKSLGFAHTQNVVEVIGECVRVLQGDSTFVSRVNALRWLVHLVGDVHQPIHVGCSFIDDTDADARLEFDPTIIRRKNLKHDRGGNSLILPVSGSPSLHTYWDSHLPVDGTPNVFRNSATTVSASARREVEVSKRHRINDLWGLIKRRASRSNTATVLANNSGSPAEWAIKWADSSLIEARHAYASLQIKRPVGNGRYELNWPGKPKYDERCRPIVARQIAAAAENLAALLNAIFQ